MTATAATLIMKTKVTIKKGKIKKKKKKRSRGNGFFSKMDKQGGAGSHTLARSGNTVCYVNVLCCCENPWSESICSRRGKDPLLRKIGVFSHFHFSLDLDPTFFYLFLASDSHTPLRPCLPPSLPLFSLLPLSTLAIFLFVSHSLHFLLPNVLSFFPDLEMIYLY